MLAEQRAETILKELAERRAVSVTDLCQVTGASEATIRRDLNTLAAQGKLSKVHGGAVRTVTTADVRPDPCGKPPYEADGLMTDLPGVALVVYSADCIPILFYDPVRRVIAAVHAGWRGTAAGIATAAVQRMETVYGCDRGDILAAIGPGIGPDCFETHEDVPNAMTAALSTAVLQHIKIKENGKFAVDLKAINAMRLEQVGLAAEHIAVSSLCTSCDPERFWSHRKLGTSRGSMAAVIQLL